MFERKSQIKKGDYVYLTKKHILKQQGEMTIVYSAFNLYQVVDVLEKEFQFFDKNTETTFLVKRSKVRAAKKYLTYDGFQNASEKENIHFSSYQFNSSLFNLSIVILLILSVIATSELIPYGRIIGTMAITWFCIKQIDKKLYTKYRALSYLWRFHHADELNRR